MGPNFVLGDRPNRSGAGPQAFKLCDGDLLGRVVPRQWHEGAARYTIRAAGQQGI